MDGSTPWLATLVVTVLTSALMSSGLWAFLEKRSNKNTAIVKLLLGLARDRIVYLGMSYIDRGWIAKDEYDDFIRYLYTPYSEFGGNGLADKVQLEVSRLPIKKVRGYPTETEKEQT